MNPRAGSSASENDHDRKNGWGLAGSMYVGFTDFILCLLFNADCTCSLYFDCFHSFSPGGILDKHRSGRNIVRTRSQCSAGTAVPSCFLSEPGGAKASRTSYSWPC